MCIKNTCICAVLGLKTALKRVILHKLSRVCLNTFAHAATSFSSPQRAHITTRAVTRPRQDRPACRSRIKNYPMKLSLFVRFYLEIAVCLHRNMEVARWTFKKN